MAAKKRSKKKAAKQKRGLIHRSLRLLGLAVVLAVAASTASYYFGSIETRGKILEAAKAQLNEVRNAAWMPHIASNAVDRLYDTVPQSEGLVVDGGELGRSLSPILAGLPQSRKAIRVLQNKTYVNLYHEHSRQPLCVAYRLSRADPQKAKPTADLINDPRVASPRPQDLQSTGWQAAQLAPAAALAKEFGVDGASEANLSSNYLPVPSEFANGLWSEALHTLTREYTSRFDEVWIYAGPIYQAGSSKLSSDIATPTALYCIVFDLTDSGGLRALSFILPTHSAADTELRDCISSIATIEQATGLSFLPEIGFDARDLLLNWVSPQLW